VDCFREVLDTEFQKLSFFC